LKDILATANGSSAKTFHKFYHKEITLSQIKDFSLAVFDTWNVLFNRWKLLKYWTFDNLFNYLNNWRNCGIIVNADQFVSTLFFKQAVFITSQSWKAKMINNVPSSKHILDVQDEGHYLNRAWGSRSDKSHPMYFWFPSLVWD
jgi:ribosomal protein S18 acetylase RimI-like enzyme